MKSAHDLVEAAKQQITEISINDAEACIRDADLLVDVREPEEYKQGHLAGAVNIPRGLLEFKFSSTPEYDSRDLDIVVYCKTSGRGALAAQSLMAMGYLQVKSIAGGFDAWLDAGKPVAEVQPIDFD